MSDARTGADGTAPRELYYQRIRSVVGQALHGRRIAVLDPQPLAVAVDALARSGVLSWRVAPGEPVAEGSPIAVAFGQCWVGVPAGEALLGQLRAHNHWEDRWDLQLCDEPEAAAGVELALTASLAGLSRARRAGVPAVAALLLDRGAATAALACHPALPGCWELAAQLGPALAPAGDDPARRLDALDAGDLAADLARLLLLDGSGREAPDLRRLVLEEQRPLVLRGSPAWPWEVAFLGVAQRPELARLLDHPWHRPRLPPLTVDGRPPRVLLVGCGTASNWLPELWSWGGDVALVDKKPFSPFNPVRQLVRTTLVDGLPKPLALIEELRLRQGSSGADPAERVRPLVALPGAEDPAALAQLEQLLTDFRPDLALVGTGRSGLGDDFAVARRLRAAGIRHLVPTAFPGVTHYKHIVVDGLAGPAYDDLQQRLPVDHGVGPTLGEEARQLYYGGTQPATLLETLPSVHSGLRLLEQLARPRALRSPWFGRLVATGRTCLVGANRTEWRDGQPLYGVPHPFQIVAYGVEDVV